MAFETYDKCPALGTRPRNCRDMMGLRYGTLTVVGYHVSGSAHQRKANAGKGNPLWVMMCDCGAFTVRPARAIRQKIEEDNRSGCCGRCHQRRKESHFAEGLPTSAAE